MTWKIQVKIPKGLVLFLGQWSAHKLLHGQFVGLVLLPLTKKLPKRFKVFYCSLMNIVMGATCPEGFLIELYVFLTDSPEYHGSKPSVAHR